jgi:hypothetical protein
MKRKELIRRIEDEGAVFEQEGRSTRTIATLGRRNLSPCLVTWRFTKACRRKSFVTLASEWCVELVVFTIGEEVERSHRAGPHGYAKSAARSERYCG